MGGQVLGFVGNVSVINSLFVCYECCLRVVLSVVCCNGNSVL